MSRKSLSKDYHSNLQRQRDREFNREVRWSAQVNYYNEIDRVNRRFQSWTSPNYYKNIGDHLLKTQQRQKQCASLEDRRQRLRDLFFREDCHFKQLGRQPQVDTAVPTHRPPNTPSCLLPEATPKQQPFNTQIEKARRIQKSFKLAEIERQLRQHSEFLQRKESTMLELRKRHDHYNSARQKIKNLSSRLRDVIGSVRDWPNPNCGNFRQKIDAILEHIKTKFACLKATLGVARDCYEHGADKIDKLTVHLISEQQLIEDEFKCAADSLVFDSEQKLFLDQQKVDLVTQFVSIGEQLLRAFVEFETEIDEVSDDVYEAMIRNVVERESTVTSCEKIQFEIDTFNK